MEYLQSTEHSSMHCGSESKVLRFLTEEQKKKVALLKLDMKIPDGEENKRYGKCNELKKKNYSGS